MCSPRLVGGITHSGVKPNNPVDIPIIHAIHYPNIIIFLLIYI